MAGEAMGVFEDVGATYPVCDRCGAVGTGRTRDGDPCGDCEDAAASSQPVRLPETTGGAH